MRRELRHVLTHASRLCGAIGSVLLLSAPLTWALTDAGTGAGALVVAKLILGGGAIGFYLAFNLRPFWRQMATKSTPLSLVSVATASCVVVILVALNTLAVLRPLEVDLTREGIHTLAKQTTELLARLSVDVEIYAFYADAEPATPLVRERLRRYAEQTSRVRLQLVDPNLRPDLVERFGISRSGHRIVMVTDAPEPREARALDASEESLTNALIEVAEGPKQVIYFLTGHGEAGIEDEGPDGFHAAATAVRGDGYVVAALRLLDTGTPPGVPADAGAVVIAGARGTLMEAELSALDTYLDNGGRALVMLEPRVSSGLEVYLRQWKIEARDDIIADSVSQMIGLGWSGPIIQMPPQQHPITESLINAVVMRDARSLAITNGGEPRVEAQAVVQTGHSAWGETALEDGGPVLDDDDNPGPLLVGVAAVRDLGDGHNLHGHAYAPVHQARLVAFGDVDWMNNRLAPQQGNTDLFLNSLGWLTEHQEKITIRPRTREHGQLALAPRDLGLLKFFSLDIMPVLVIGLGVGVVLMRRRR